MEIRMFSNVEFGVWIFVYHLIWLLTVGEALGRI